MQKLIMSHVDSFLFKEEEIARLLSEGWTINEGPFLIGNLIVLKLDKLDSSYKQFEDKIDQTTESDHQW